MVFAPRRKRKLKGDKYAHRVMLARTARQQRGELLAILGTLLVVAALIFAAVGWYQGHYATAGVDLGHLEDTPEVRARLEQAIATLSQAKVLQNMGGLAQLIGGGFITSALLLQRFRKRWFFFSTLGLGAVLLWMPVVGTVFAAVWFGSLYLTRREFFGSIPTAIPV